MLVIPMKLQDEGKIIFKKKKGMNNTGQMLEAKWKII